MDVILNQPCYGRCGTPKIVLEKTTVGGSQTMKFMKVFSLKTFLLLVSLVIHYLSRVERYKVCYYSDTKDWIHDQ